jgi:hypothetical protein
VRTSAGRGGLVRVQVAGLMPALIKTEWRVLVAHHGHIDEDAAEPAVDADEQVEERAGLRRVINRKKPARTTMRLRTE